LTPIDPLGNFMNFSLSIIVPCYNVEVFVTKTLVSLSQLIEAENCEFILVNDGSTDETLKYLQEFANKDKRAIVIDQSNQGVSSARNTALERAKGQYILCLDGDDYLSPNTIQIIRNGIKNADALLTPCIHKLENKEYTIPLDLQDGLYSVEKLYSLCNIFPTAPMIVYKTSIIQQNHLKFLMLMRLKIQL
jgi:glycosyltransferase involved in cell wall biosynthesis